MFENGQFNCNSQMEKMFFNGKLHNNSYLSAYSLRFTATGKITNQNVSVSKRIGVDLKTKFSLSYKESNFYISYADE